MKCSLKIDLIVSELQSLMLVPSYKGKTANCSHHM